MKARDVIEDWLAARFGDRYSKELFAYQSLRRPAPCNSFHAYPVDTHIYLC